MIFNFCNLSILAELLVAFMCCPFIHLSFSFFFTDYYYVTMEEFEELIAKNGFLEHAQFSGNRYGTRWDFLSSFSLLYCMLCSIAIT